MGSRPTPEQLVLLPKIEAGLEIAKNLGLPRLIEIARWFVHYGYATKINDLYDLKNAAIMAARFLDLDLNKLQGGEDLALRIVQLFSQVLEIKRCGHPDFYPLAKQAEGVNGWAAMGVKTVLVRVTTPLTTMSQKDQEDLTAQCIKAWQNVCGLQARMTTANDSSAHVSIGLCDRTDGSDGRGGMLAFTYLPTDWSAQQLPIPLLFDIAETFGPSASQQVIGYREVVTHELGHSLIGLTHAPQNVPALMAPFYKAGLMTPQSNDIQRALTVWPLQAPAPLPAPSSPVVPPASSRTISKIVVSYSDGTILTLT